MQTTASLNTLTGSVSGVVNGLMTYTSSVIPRILQTTASLNTFTGSARIELNSIEAYTASLKGAAIVSSSTQIQNYFLFAQTSSANTFYGNQTITGSLFVSSTTVSDSTLLASGSNLILNSGSNLYINNAGFADISGSLRLTGSLNVGFSSGTSELQVRSTGVNIGNALTDRHLVTGSLLMTGSMTISSGSITMPNRPAFRVVGTASTDRVAQTTLSGSYASIDYNEGNYYNNSTGIFTAPLAGLYNVYYNGRCGNVNSMQQVIIYKNGAAGTVQLMWEAPGNTGVAHFGVSGVFKLAAGDTLEAKVAVGSIQFDGNDTWGAAYIG
jgi:hypothetical protein